MPEFRQNPATRQWVILSPERTSRPNCFITPSKSADAKQGELNCPFCPGNEHMTPPETLRVSNACVVLGNDKWSVRSVPNKYPALAYARENGETHENFFVKVQGNGCHEVMVDTPLHFQAMHEMSDSQIRDIIFAYLNRYREFITIPHIRSIVLFKNAGAMAGCSIEHPHTQILASALVPRDIQERLDIAIQHYEKHDSCLYCRMLDMELREKKRIVLETEHFVVFHPFASKSPYETWILPRRHTSCFGEVTELEALELGFLLREILRCFGEELGAFDYNYLVQSVPLNGNGRVSTGRYHWHAQVIPKLTMPAGFEVATGMYINPVMPEASAKTLRSVVIW